MRTLAPLLIGLSIMSACAFGGVALASTDLFKSDSRVALELEQQRRAAELAQQRAEEQRPMWTFLSVVAVAAGVIVAGLYVYNWHADRAVQRRRLQPDANGRYAIDTTQLSRDVAQQLALVLASGQMQANIAAAKASQVLPHNYAPKIEVEHAPALPQPVAPALLPALPEPEPVAVPASIELSDSWNQIKPGHVAFGAVAGGELLQLPLGRIYHALFHGDTGGGKTNAIDSMIVQLHRMAARGVSLQLYAGDYKRELAATWRRSALFGEGIQTEPIDIANMLADLAEETRLRQATFERAGTATGRIIRNYSEYVGVTGEQLPVIVCIVDELNAVLEASAGTALDSNLRTLLQMGRASGVLVHGGFQYMTSNVFGRDGSKQFITRAHFGAYDQTAVKMLFGVVDHKALQPLVTGQAGRGLIRTVGQTQPMVFQALHCSEQDILDAISGVSNVSASPVFRADMTPSNVVPFTMERVINASECPVIDVMPQPVTLRATGTNGVSTSVQSVTDVTGETPQHLTEVDVPELERVQIIALARAGVSRRKIGETVYGTIGGAAYTKVKHILDVAGL